MRSPGCLVPGVDAWRVIHAPPSQVNGEREVPRVHLGPGRPFQLQRDAPVPLADRWARCGRGSGVGVALVFCSLY